MKITKVLHPSNLPTRIPVTFAIVMWLLLDRLQAAGWVYGVVFTVVGILFVVAAISIWNREYVKLWDNE